MIGSSVKTQLIVGRTIRRPIINSELVCVEKIAFFRRRRALVESLETTGIRLAQLVKIVDRETLRPKGLALLAPKDVVFLGKRREIDDAPLLRFRRRIDRVHRVRDHPDEVSLVPARLDQDDEARGAEKARLEHLVIPAPELLSCRGAVGLDAVLDRIVEDQAVRAASRERAAAPDKEHLAALFQLQAVDRGRAGKQRNAGEDLPIDRILNELAHVAPEIPGEFFVVGAEDERLRRVAAEIPCGEEPRCQLALAVTRAEVDDEALDVPLLDLFKRGGDHTMVLRNLVFRLIWVFVIVLLRHHQTREIKEVVARQKRRSATFQGKKVSLFFWRHIRP